jgi:hypothetical protein
MARGANGLVSTATNPQTRKPANREPRYAAPRTGEYRRRVTDPGTDPTKAEPGPTPPFIDTKRPNVARVYDYWLGGYSL